MPSGKRPPTGRVPVAGGHLPYGLEQRLQPSGLVLHAGIRPDLFEQCQAVAARRHRPQAENRAVGRLAAGWERTGVYSSALAGRETR